MYNESKGPSFRGTELPSRIVLRSTKKEVKEPENRVSTE